MNRQSAPDRRPPRSAAPSSAKRPSEAKKPVRVVRSTMDRRAKSGPPVAVRQTKKANYILETRPDTIKKPFPFAILFCILAVMIVAMYVLSLRVTLDSLTSDISRMEREIKQGVEEQNALQVRLNAKYDLTEIERIAKEEYGMVNRDTLSKKYISVSGEDQVEILKGSRAPAETESTQPGGN